MPLVARILADLVVVVHAGYVLFVVVGLLATLLGAWRGWPWVRNRTFRYVHLAMIGVVVAESWVGITCPLTIWEQWLRQQAGEATYRGDFIANVVHELLFIDAPAWVFTITYTLFGLLVVLTFVLVPPASPGRNQSANPRPWDGVAGEGKSAAGRVRS
jgi:hypothetical protein